jgi:hypothetical protein
VVKRFLVALGTGDVDTVKSVITDDFQAIATGTSLVSGTRGYDDIVRLCPVFGQVTKGGFSYDFLNMTAEEDRVSAEMQGYAELVTGARYDNQYHFLFFLRKGKICKMKEYFDTKLAVKVWASFFPEETLVKSDS